MNGTLLIISMGELGTNVLEAVSRTNLFQRIVVASRSKKKAVERANNALIGAGIEGFFPTLESVALDATDPGFVKQIKEINPDVVFTAPTLMPWWKISEPSTASLPFGGSFPDVINVALTRSGFGPLCGIGNVQEPIAKIKAGIGQIYKRPAQQVSVHLVAQHAFEYYAMREEGSDVLPPHLLKVELDGNDVSTVAEEVLKEPFPFPYDLHFNRVTASAGLVALEALVSAEPRNIHLPGCLGLPGGYPVRVSQNSIELDLPECWNLDQAMDVNMRSMAWDGIAVIEGDGTIQFTEETSHGLHKLIGGTCDHVTPATANRQAEALLKALI